MGIKGIFKFILHRIFEFTLAVLLIVLLPNLPPYTNFSESFRVTPNKPFEGKLELKETLSNVEIWHKGDFVGPESFADYNGELYVSLFGGDIVKLNGNHITPVVKFGKPCKGPYEEKICGRPLGLEFDKSGTLYAADAYYGIFKVDVKTGQKIQLISPNEEINGKKPKLFNAIALAANGDFYWSDSSSEFYLEDGIFDMLADPSGRLIHYDAKTKKNKVLIDKISFANGVVLSDDEEFVLVAETGRNRIQRYYLKGPKQGRRDIFIDGLPGMPDNLKPDGQGNFIVPLVLSVDTDHPALTQMISPFPLIRKFIARTMGLVQLLFQTVDKYYPNEFSQKAVHFVGHFTSLTSLGSFISPKRTTVLRITKNGEIQDSLHSLNNKINHICEGYIFKDTLYLGSPFNDYLARIHLSEIGWSQPQADRKRREVPQESVKQESTTKIPTTVPSKQETPKPTVAPSSSKPTQSPKSQTTTPLPKQPSLPEQQRTPSPRKETPSKDPTPTEQKLPKQDIPPKQQTAHLKQETVPPKQETPPPKRETLPPKQQTPPPKQQTSSSKPQTQPPEQQAPPPKPQTPPPKSQNPPPKQQTPPQQAPPSKQQTPPQKQQTPPQKQQTPPPTQSPTPKQETPLKQDTSSQKQQTPPKQQGPSSTPTQQEKQATPSKQVPPAQPSKQSSPPVKEQVKSSQAKDSTQSK